MEGFWEIYSDISEINQLEIENGHLKIAGFDKRYEQWLSKKQQVFEEEVKKKKLRAEQYETFIEKRELLKAHAKEEERTQVIKESRAIDLDKAMNIFLGLSLGRQKEVLRYTKKIAVLKDSACGIHGNTPIEEQFKIIYGKVPNSIRENIKRKMERNPYYR